MLNKYMIYDIIPGMEEQNMLKAIFTRETNLAANT